MTKRAQRAVAWARRHPLAVDALVAGAFAAAALLSMHLVYEDVRQVDPTFHLPGTFAVVFAMLTTTLPLAWRRRFPLVTVIVVCTAFGFGRVILDVNEPVVTVLACYLAIYSAALHGRPPWRTPALVTAVSLIMAEVVREVVAPGFGGSGPLKAFVLAYNAVVLVLPWWLGAAMRARYRRERELMAQTFELKHEREENARRAVFEERVRIARELHDVVAHHVSVMGVQAAGARRVMRRQPDQAEQALSAIEGASRQAVIEMDRLLGFLRREGEVDDLAPQPGLGQLDELVTQLSSAGLSVELSVEGEPSPLPRTVEVSAYRVVQEALTNTLKHSGGATASVRVSYGTEALEVDVIDEGPGRPGHALEGGGGHGLMGMRERVGLHGGHVRAGPRTEGGFAVHARFPLNGREG